MYRRFEEISIQTALESSVNTVRMHRYFLRVSFFSDLYFNVHVLGRTRS